MQDQINQGDSRKAREWGNMYSKEIQDQVELGDIGQEFHGGEQEQKGFILAGNTLQGKKEWVENLEPPESLKEAR